MTSEAYDVHMCQEQVYTWLLVKVIRSRGRGISLKEEESIGEEVTLGSFCRKMIKLFIHLCHHPSRKFCA